MCLPAGREGEGNGGTERVWACTKGGGDTACDNWAIKSHKGTDTFTMWLRETITLQWQS